MPSKSAGQWVGAVVGAVVGFYAGGPMGAIYGASLGAGIGGIVDPPKGPVVDGPRLTDLSTQSFQFGAPIARDDGTVGHMGTVIWVENNALREVVRREEQGGKGGGGGATTRTYTYYATFAVALCDAPPEGIIGVRRIWMGPNLIYDVGSEDLETVLASNLAAEGFRIYFGTDNQMPDPRIEAEMGVGNAPAFRGTAYIVFYDAELTKYGNTLMGAQIKAELIVSGAPLPSDVIASFPVTDIVRTFTVPSTMVTANVAYHGYWEDEGNPETGGNWVVIAHSTTGSRRSGSYTRFNRYYDEENEIYRVDLQAPWGFEIFIGDALNASWGTAGYHTGSFNGLVRILTNSGGTVEHPGLGMSISDHAKKCVYDNGHVYVLAHTNLGSRLIRTGMPNGFDRTDEFFFDFCAGPDYLYALASDTFPTTSFTLHAISKSTSLNTLYTVPISVPIAITPNGTWLSFYEGILWIAPSENDETLIGLDPFTGQIVQQINDIPPPAVVGGSRPSAVVDGFLIRDNSQGSGDAIEVIRILNPGSESPSLASIVTNELLRSEQLLPEDLHMLDLEEDSVRGFTRAGVKQIRANLAPLQIAWPFDLIQDGYQIRAVRRGKSSTVEIPIEHLDAREYGDAYGIQLESAREMDSQLPRQVVVRNLDGDREYDTNEQRSKERQNSGAVNIQEVELALVLTPNEAAQIADVVHTVAWLQKGGPYKFMLPPIYRALQPADVVTVVAPYARFELRFDEITYYSDGRIDCVASLNSSASYSSVAVGVGGLVPPGTIPLAGNSHLVLMDIPLIRNVDDQPAFAAGMTGQSNSWPGGVAYRSIDNEQTWTLVQPWTSPVTMGIARNALTAHDDLTIDRVSTLQVDLYQGTISSITEAQMMTGMHWCAYGVDGRWEIIRFAGAALQSDGSYLLTTIARGLRGSEWATGLHVAGDYFVLLDDPDVLRIGADISSLNVIRQWRGITVGQSIDAVDSIDFAYRGVNLMPLAPQNIQGYISGGDWLISFSPRTRLQGTLWKTGMELPVGESIERYYLDIFDGAPGSTIVRTLISTTPSFEYTADQQMEDFGGIINNIYVEASQASATVGRGYRSGETLSSAFVMPHLLLHFDGSNGSTTFTDSSPFMRTPTVVGNAQISTAQFRFGGASGYFDGTGDYVSFPHSADFSVNQDFTIEGWLYTLSSASTQGIILRKNPNTQRNTGFSLEKVGAGAGTMLFVGDGTTQYSVSSGISLPTNTWTYFAAVKQGNNLMMFINGVLMNTTVITGSIIDNTAPVSVGGNVIGGASWNGYIDELRFVRQALYTTSFTTPSTPFPS